MLGHLSPSPFFFFSCSALLLFTISPLSFPLFSFPDVQGLITLSAMDVAVSVVYVCTHLPDVDRDASSSVSTAVFCTLGRSASIDASPSYARVVRAHAAGELAALTGVGPSRSPWSSRRSCPPRQWCTPRARRSSARYRVASVQRGAVCSTIVGLAASTSGYLSMIVFLEGAPAAVTRSTAVCTWRHQSTCGAVARLTRPGGGWGGADVSWGSALAAVDVPVAAWDFQRRRNVRPLPTCCYGWVTLNPPRVVPVRLAGGCRTYRRVGPGSDHPDGRLSAV